MALRPMKDLVVVLPGIMGSVLAKHGRELWTVSLGMAARVAQREALQRELILDGDDAERPSLDDGVIATRLMDDAHLIPGFWKVDGYTSLLTAIVETFDVTIGNIYQPDPDANLFPFPYDWRRDNRSSARRLQAFIQRQLPIWRERSGSAGAKVILIGHSMGGLIARYYLEVLGGREDCAALYTFGTPHRGSLNALGFLANGYTLMKWLDVSAALRSYTAAYQLLPTYEVVSRANKLVAVPDLTEVPTLSPARAREAYEQFHAPIESAARARAAAGPLYRYTAIIGTQQQTHQSAQLVAGALTMSPTLPEPLQKRNIPGFGDGTVPLYAAMPPGIDAYELERVYVSDAHGSLQANLAMQQHLVESLHMLQVQGDLLGAGPFAAGVQPGLRLILEDAYPAEGGLARVEPVGLGDNPGDLIVTITHLDGERPPEQRRLPFRGDGWSIELEHPAPGLYRLSVETYALGARPGRAVQDLFEVAPAPHL